jgi:hypothetical protein
MKYTPQFEYHNDEENQKMITHHMITLESSIKLQIQLLVEDL